MFALVVFVSDGILQVNDTTTTTPAARYFKIVAQLPLELQMVLCFRLVGSDKEIIPGKESEADVISCLQSRPSFPSSLLLPPSLSLSLSIPQARFQSHPSFYFYFSYLQP